MIPDLSAEGKNLSCRQEDFNLERKRNKKEDPGDGKETLWKGLQNGSPLFDVEGI